MKPMLWVLGVIVIGMAGFAAYVRLAPSDPAVWHIDLEQNCPEQIRFAQPPPEFDLVMEGTGNAWFDVYETKEKSMLLLARLDQIAMAHAPYPPTCRGCGSGTYHLGNALCGLGVSRLHDGTSYNAWADGLRTSSIWQKRSWRKRSAVA